jgi:FkbM family methyltransferase
MRRFIQKFVKLLDRPKTRWIISSFLPLVSRLSSCGVRNLYYDNGWIHYFDDGIIVEPEPRARAIHVSEQQVILTWGFLYKPRVGDTIIDVGAGLGSESFYYAKIIGPTGRLLSIEAHPKICSYLKRTIQLNNFYWAEAVNQAVADKPRVVLIENDAINHLSNCISDDQRSGGISVDALPLDAICEQHGIATVDFLKMNIEGAERLAVRGMGTMIRATRYISISCHDFKFRESNNSFYRTRAIIEKFLIEQGFEIIPRHSDVREFADQLNAFNRFLVSK